MACPVPSAKMPLLLVITVFLRLDPIAALEKHGKAPRHHRHPEKALGGNGQIEVSLDRKGVSHMRRESEVLIETPGGQSEELIETPGHHHSHNSEHHHHHHSSHSHSEEPGHHHHHHHGGHHSSHSHSEALLQDDPSTEPSASEQVVQSAQAEEKLEHERAEVSTHGQPKLDNLGQAENEIEKVDEITKTAEEKAGLPDSTKTTPEPESDGPSDEEQETNALMFAGIALIVLVGAAAAGWSIWLARRMKGKAGEKAPLAEGEGEGEGEEAEAEAEGETAEAEGEK